MNLKLALRRLFKTPFVSLVAIVSLALGIGANAAIFSLYDQTLLRPLPVVRPVGTGQLLGAGPEAGIDILRPGRELRGSFQLPDVSRYRTAADRLHRRRRARRLRRQPRLSRPDAERAGHARLGLVLPGPRVCSRRSDASSRLDDDRNIGSHFVTVLSHDYWTTRLSARIRRCSTTRSSSTARH